jgi:endonuclease-3
MRNRAQERIPAILELLERHYPAAECALRHEDPLQLLVATILSAQCTDERVNLVTPALFRRYPDAAAFAGADLGELEALIRTTGFFRSKARNIRECCRQIVERFGGRVPPRLEDLVTLPGVGRKTANVVLGTVFGIPGITVDTHVNRITRRLGLTRHEDPVKIEFDLMKLVPESLWSSFSIQVIWHGRRICFARKPLCETCFLRDICPYPARASYAMGRREAAPRSAARRRPPRRRSGRRPTAARRSGVRRVGAAR